MGATRAARVPEPRQADFRESVRTQVLHVFAEHLSEIRLAAGNPSYRALHRIDRSLRSSTIGDVLNGKSAPTDAFVRAYVRACRSAACGNGLAVDGELFDESKTFDRWRQLQRDLREHRRQTRRPYGSDTGSDVGVIGRVLDGLRRMPTA